MRLVERLRVSTAEWPQTLAQFGRWFHRAVGRAASLEQFAAARGRSWLQGVRRNRLAFGR